MKAHEEFMAWPALRVQLDLLEQAASSHDEQAIRAVLKTCVHGFSEEPRQEAA